MPKYLHLGIPLYVKNNLNEGPFQMKPYEGNSCFVYMPVRLLIYKSVKKCISVV